MFHSIVDEAMMPLDKGDFSTPVASTSDRFGIAWQLSLH